jgi:hypothetical protein
MMPGEDLINFVNKILAINTPMFNLLGSSPGLSGGAISSTGALSSGGNMTLQLKNLTIAFAKAYRDNKVSLDSVIELAQKLEGLLMAEATLSLLTQLEVNQLINQLHDLTDAKK